jgi:hypothetical protein
MLGTPFTHPAALERLRAAGIALTQQAAQADVIVSHRVETLLLYRLRFPWKRFLVWTNEPRFDTHFSTQTSFAGLARVEVMNVYSDAVFWNNLHFLGSYHFNSDVNLGMNLDCPLPPVQPGDVRDFEKKKVAAFFSYRGGMETRLLKDSVDIDLEQARLQSALTGKRRGLVDIFGKDWPQGLASENSGYGCEVKEGERPLEWWDRKLEVLRGYLFNLCLENTAFGHYCTEKIWHAILAGCLPIYHGRGTKIYETFPAHSFLDCSEFADFDQLFDAVEAMTLEEYVERRNACIRVYNESCAQKRLTQSIAETTDKLIARLNASMR